MVVPVPLMLHAMQVIAAHRSSEAAHKSHAHKAELAAQIEKLKIAASQERVESQKTVLLALLAASESAFNNKLERYAAGLEAIRAHVEARRASYEEEIKDIRRNMRLGDADERVAARARMADIDEELEGLDHLLMQAKREHDQIVHATSLDPRMDSDSLPLLPPR